MSHSIVAMEKSHINEVANLHRKVFPQSRSTKLGKPYVRKMFRWFITYQPELCLICIEKGKITGYVVGAIGGYGRKLFRYAFFEVLLGLLIHPKLWFQKNTFLLWRSYLKGLRPQPKKPGPLNTDQNTIISAALAGIGVDNDQRGKGVGQSLVYAYEKAAKEAGAKKLTLSVQKDNHAAQKVYEKCGWYIDRMNVKANTVHYTKVVT